MRKHISRTLVLLISFSMIFPSLSYCWPYGHYQPHKHHYRYGGCCNGCGYHRYNGWGVGGAIAGGIIIGVVVGNLLTHSTRYDYVSRRTYEPTQSRVAYACPDPGFVARYSKKKPPGEWIIVPGQLVDEKWVPEHKVWVPVDPE
jgi:hypothetical protein